MFALSLLNNKPPQDFSKIVESYTVREDANSYNEGPQRALANVQKTNYVYADLIESKKWKAPAKMFLSDKLSSFMDRFEIQITDATNIEQVIMETKSEIFDRSVPNTTPRITHFQTRSYSGGSVFFQQGIIADMYALRQPEGRLDWDLRFQALVANLSNSVGAAAFSGILSGVTAFARGSVFEKGMNHDPVSAFNSMCHLNNIIQKSEHAMTDVVKKLDDLFDNGVKSLITSREMGMQLLNTDMLSYMKSGLTGVALASNLNQLKSVNGGVLIDALPIVEPDSQNVTDKQWLRNMQMTWMIIPHAHPGRDMVKMHGSRLARMVEVCDMETDDWHQYELDDTIANTPWFDETGALDTSYLDTFARCATEEYEDFVSGNMSAASRRQMNQRPFALSGTVPFGNENSLPLLMFIHKGEDIKIVNNIYPTAGLQVEKDAFFRIDSVGNLPHEWISTNYLVDIVNQACNVFETAQDFWRKIFDADTQKRLYAVYQLVEFLISKKKDIVEVAKLDETSSKAIFSTYMGPKDSLFLQLYLPHRISKENPELVFAGRLKELTTGADAKHRAIAIMLLFSPISAKTISRLMYHGIDSYLGAIILRCEHRLMDSVIATADSKYGKLFTPGVEASQFEVGMTASGENKEIYLGLGVGVGYINDKERRFCPVMSVCGSHPVRGWGGSSPGFYPQRDIIKAKVPPTIGEYLENIDKGKSNFAVLVPHNCLVENTLPSSFAVCGYYTRSMFLQYLDSSTEFTKERRVPLFPGSPGFLFSCPFLHQQEKAIDPEKTTFRDIALERARSPLAGVGTCRVMSRNGESVITPPRHMDGFVGPLSRDRLQGYELIGSGMASVKQDNGTVLFGELIGAGGVSAGMALRGKFY